MVYKNDNHIIRKLNWCSFVPLKINTPARLFWVIRETLFGKNKFYLFDWS